MLGLKPALPRVLSFPRNPRVPMQAQTIFITETDDATAKTERGWYMVGSSAGGHMQNTINAGSGLKAMLDKRHLAVAGKFMTLLTLPDGTTQWSSAIPPRPNTKDAVQFVMKLDVTTANGVGPGTSGWARKMDEDLVGNLRYPGGVSVRSVDGDEDGNMYVSYEGLHGLQRDGLFSCMGPHHCRGQGGLHQEAGQAVGGQRERGVGGRCTHHATKRNACALRVVCTKLR